MIVKLLTEHHLEFRSLQGGCRGSSETTLVKMSHCWKSHVMAQYWCHNLANCHMPTTKSCTFVGGRDATVALLA